VELLLELHVLDVLRMNESAVRSCNISAAPWLPSLRRRRCQSAAAAP
jgi:hypothetical protein